MEWLNWVVENWRVALAVAIALLFVLTFGGYYWKLKREVAEFIEVIKLAIEDGDVNDLELAKIIKEGKDVGRTLKEITFAVTQLFPKFPKG